MASRSMLDGEVYSSWSRRGWRQWLTGNKSTPHTNDPPAPSSRRDRLCSHGLRGPERHREPIARERQARAMGSCLSGRQDAQNAAHGLRIRKFPVVAEITHETVLELVGVALIELGDHDARPQAQDDPVRVGTQDRRAEGTRPLRLR